jgi:hypothetical protein
VFRKPGCRDTARPGELRQMVKQGGGAGLPRAPARRPARSLPLASPAAAGARVRDARVRGCSAQQAPFPPTADDRHCAIDRRRPARPAVAVGSSRRHSRQMTAYPVWETAPAGSSRS